MPDPSYPAPPTRLLPRQKSRELNGANSTIPSPSPFAFFPLFQNFPSLLLLVSKRSKENTNSFFQFSNGFSPYLSPFFHINNKFLRTGKKDWDFDVIYKNSLQFFFLSQSSLGNSGFTLKIFFSNSLYLYFEAVSS